METKDQYSASTLKKLILDTIKNEMLIEPELASDDAYYEAVCRVIRRILTERYKVFNAHANSVATKKVYYMSMEFLMGRSLKNSLYNLGSGHAYGIVIPLCFLFGCTAALFCFSAACKKYYRYQYS